MSPQIAFKPALDQSTMDVLQNYLFLLLSLLLMFYISKQIILKKRNIENEKLPPTPPSVPIIGHLHLLKLPLHKTINTLANKYGPIFLLRLGSRPVLVVSTPSAVEECFTENDTIFSNRPLLPSRKISTYNFTNIGAPYGKQWRNLRRFFALEVFSSVRLHMSSDIRKEEIRFMTKYLFRGDLGKQVDVKSFVYMLDFNIMMRIVAGKRCFEEEEIMDLDKLGEEKLDFLKHNFNPSMEMALGDHFPFLRWLTYFGVEKKMAKAHKKRDAFLQALIDAHRNNQNTTSPSDHGDPITQTLIHVMLKLQETEPAFYTDIVIKGIMQTMLTAGTHTTVMAMEWVIQRLISQPEFLKRARDELDDLVGQNRLLSDADLPKLHYLHGIINETLRLNSALAILPPRESSEECTIAGYNIPQGTQLWVNLWAMHMDPELWTEPESFKPERFLQGDEEKGKSKFLAFGLGRRQCPGAGLATRIMALSLGTLIQCFDWKKTEEESHVALETKSNNGQEKSLKIIFQPREALTKPLSQL